MRWWENRWRLRCSPAKHKKPYRQCCSHPAETVDPATEGPGMHLLRWSSRQSQDYCIARDKTGRDKAAGISRARERAREKERRRRPRARSPRPPLFVKPVSGPQDSGLRTQDSGAQDLINIIGLCVSYKWYAGDLGSFPTQAGKIASVQVIQLSLIHISEPTRLRRISYAVF